MADDKNTQVRPGETATVRGADAPRNEVATKAFRMRQGAGRHVQDGEAISPGDVVHLTRVQVNAFRDKFEPVDDSDFKVEREFPRFRREEQKETTRAAATSGDPKKSGVTDKDSTGAPVAQPAIPVPANKGITGTSPADVTATDPAKQGQQSREQRDIIDSGRAPMPKSAMEPAKDGSKGQASRVPTGTGATGTVAAAGAPTGGNAGMGSGANLKTGGKSDE